MFLAQSVWISQSFIEYATNVHRSAEGRLGFGEILITLMHSSFGIAFIFCAAWVAISKHVIIGPFWFENANQEPVTVRKERYIEVLNKLWGALGLLSRGRGRNMVQRDIQWFQQDGAPPHTANITLDWLDHKFPNQLISRKREPE